MATNFPAKLVAMATRIICPSDIGMLHTCTRFRHVKMKDNQVMTIFQILSAVSAGNALKSNSMHGSMIRHIGCCGGGTI